MVKIRNQSLFFFISSIQTKFLNVEVHFKIMAHTFCVYVDHSFIKISFVDP